MDSNESTPLLKNVVEPTEVKSSHLQDDLTVEVTGSQSGLSEGKTTWYASVFLVINAALGAGLLEFPYAFSKSGGITAALVVQMVLISFIVGSLFLLAYCSKLNNSDTFPGTIRTICGTKVEVTAAICIILYTYGTCITFLIVINDQLVQLFYFITHDTNFCQRWYMSKDFTLIVTSVLFILPLCFSKQIDFLKYVSFAGVIAVLYVVVLIIARYFHPINDQSKIEISTSPSSFMDVFTVIPTVCFSYQCHVSIIPIYSCMKGRTTKNFAKTVLLAIALCLFAYSVSASLGYYTFGNAVDQDILRSYKPPPVDVMIGVFMIAAKTYTTYPILAYCGRVEVEKLCCYALRLTSSEQIGKHELKRRCAIALLWFVTSLLIALYVPNIAIVIDVLGGLAALFIFFFPGMCLFRIAVDYIDASRKLQRSFLLGCSIFFMVLGAFLFGLVTVQSIEDDATGQKPSPLNNSTCLS